MLRASTRIRARPDHPASKFGQRGPTRFPLDKDSNDNKDVPKSLMGTERNKQSSRCCGCRHQLYWSLRRCWSRSSRSSKVSIVLVASLLVIHLVLGCLDVWFRSFGLTTPSLSSTTISSKTKSAASFAVVINTYKRPRMLQEAVTHYADTCGPKFGVAQVFVVWSEQGTIPPEAHSLLLRQQQRPTQRETEHETNRAATADVHVLQVSRDSLNSRFEPIPQLQSDAIFMVDDDVRVSCSSLSLGFDAWTSYPDAMVGYYPRLALPRRPATRGAAAAEAQQQLVYHGWPTVFVQGRFNFVLTKACFLHRRYLDIYSNPAQHPRQITNYVDEHKNCEDVAMALLVANYTRGNNGYNMPSYPIYIEGSVQDKGLFGGISTGAGHMSTRSKCLSDLSKVYESHGWGIPLFYTTRILKQSWVNHYPGFWWQYRPSNFFEWFALENILS